MRAVLTLFVLVAAAPSIVGAEGYVERLAAENERLGRALKKRCPKRSKDIDRLRIANSKPERRDLLVSLEACGKSLELYHLRTASAHFALGDFKRAEASSRRALALRVSESAQVGLLNALVRQKKLSRKQKADLEKHLDYFRTRSCQREDLCAGLAYVAWHLDEHRLTRRAAARAISLEFPGWQPYFFGGSAYAVGAGADPKKARSWLLEAKKRGGPAAIDGLLARLPRQ